MTWTVQVFFGNSLNINIIFARILSTCFHGNLKIWNMSIIRCPKNMIEKYEITRNAINFSFLIKMILTLECLWGVNFILLNFNMIRSIVLSRCFHTHLKLFITYIWTSLSCKYPQIVSLIFQKYLWAFMII